MDDPFDLDDPCVRLLICQDCHTIEPLPWFDGMPAHDASLKDATERHLTDGRAHLGVLATVRAATWESDPGLRCAAWPRICPRRSSPDMTEPPTTTAW